MAAFDTGVARVLELIKAPGTVDHQIESPFGSMTRGVFLMAPFMDLLIHKWDPAKGTGQSTTLDSGLVEVCYDTFSPQMEGMLGVQLDGTPIFGPEIQVAADPSMQDKLIGIMGRQA